MENKPRKLMLCNGGWSNHPYVLIKGKWFKCFGFNVGDQVTVTNTAPGVLTMTVTKTAEMMNKEREQLARQIRSLTEHHKKTAA